MDYEKELNAWKLTKTKELLRKYVSALPLYLPKDQYKEILKDLGADSYLVSKFQEYNSKVCKDAVKSDEMKLLKTESVEKILEELKANYYKSSKC